MLIIMLMPMVMVMVMPILMNMVMVMVLGDQYTLLICLICGLGCGLMMMASCPCRIIGIGYLHSSA